jgi:hypothetical protein
MRRIDIRRLKLSMDVSNLVLSVMCCRCAGVFHFMHFCEIQYPATWSIRSPHRGWEPVGTRTCVFHGFQHYFLLFQGIDGKVMGIDKDHVAFGEVLKLQFNLKDSSSSANFRLFPGLWRESTFFTLLRIESNRKEKGGSPPSIGETST